MGSIVVYPESAHRFGVNYFIVVDGQQRLATLLLWLCAIRDRAKEIGAEDISDGIKKYYLFAQGDNFKSIPKLQLGQLDNEIFQKILEGDFRGLPDRHLILDCYKFFKNETKDINIYQKLLNNIFLIHINTFNLTNAFKLFETLNDRGLELSAADLIKNFILMKVEQNKEIFSNILEEWNEMYEKIKEREPIKFIRKFMLANYEGKFTEKKLYEEFSNKVAKEFTSDKFYDFVQKLNESATLYRKFFEPNFESEKINKKLNDLNLIEVTPSFTLLLKVMPYFENKNIPDSEMLKILEMIETFHVRWGICDQATSKLDSIYHKICMELKGKIPSECVKVIKQELCQEIKRNVDDETFKKSFRSRSFNPAEKRTKYILWKLSQPTGETLLNIGEIQTEHIMPQKLSESWISYLKNITGKIEEEIKSLHKEYLNKIGNLAIIKSNWNARMSNRIFDEKKKDYSNSEFSITKKLSEYEKWTFDEIDQRTEEMANLALQIWKVDCD